MSYAVFFHGGQAIHLGFLDVGSHACVHAGDDPTLMKQLNYHSVVDLTKVQVTYDASALQAVCCERMHFLGITRKGAAPNPCRGVDPAACAPAAAPASP